MTEPKIRFPEYKDEWVESPLEGILVENLDPIPTPREGYRRVGIYCHAKGTFQEDVPSDKVLDVDTMYKIHKDNLIVNITFAWEHAIAIVKPEDEGMLVSHRFPEYEFNKGHIPLFYKYLILRPYMKNQLSLASPGGAGRNRVLNKKQFMQIPVYVPCEAEQQKIANFLSNVDGVIAASEEEVANLEQQKKAVMQKIFSQEVRFKKEDGSDFPDWENRTLVSMCDSISDGDWIESKDQSELGVRLIQTGNVGIGTFINKAGKEKWISEETFARLRCKEVKPGTILVSRLPSPAGRACIVPDTGSKMITAVDCSIVCVNDDYCDDYIVQYLCSSNYFKDVEAFLAGGTRKRISRGNLETIIVPIPTDNDEQQLIADFLTSYDEAITAAKQELAKWKELKKGLLQQMFV